MSLLVQNMDTVVTSQKFDFIHCGIPHEFKVQSLLSSTNITINLLLGCIKDIDIASMRAIHTADRDIISVPYNY